LTDEIETKAWDYIKKIDELGGAASAIEQGFYQQEIQQAAYEEQKRIDSDEQIVVGVNKFQMDEGEQHLEILKVDAAVEANQVVKLKAFKENRDLNVLNEKLQTLKKLAMNPPEKVSVTPETNLMYPIIDCVKAGASLGEISDALRDVFGEYTESF
jgi:methylmalonyl-CoA mutase N-terminal domain/subunit